MHTQIGIALIQIILGVILSCTSLIKVSIQPYDPTQTQQSNEQPTSIPYSGLFLLGGVAVMGKGLYDLWDGLFNTTESSSAGYVDFEEDYSEETAPQQYPNPYANPYCTPAHPNYGTVNQNTTSQFENSEMVGSHPNAAGFKEVMDYSEPKSMPIGGDRALSAPNMTTVPSGIHAYSSTSSSATTKPNFSLPLRSYLLSNILSWVLCGPPGIGKTTLLLCWIADTTATSPGVRFFINGWKNDRWLGLAKLPGVFKRNSHNLETGLVDFSGFFEQVNSVAAILYERLDISEEKRTGLPKVWLVLDDYFATADSLNKTKGDVALQWEKARTHIGQIITLGREVGVALCAGTHSVNIKALGIEDANIRGCLGICAMGKVYRNQLGRKEGGHETIINTIRNPYIIGSEYIASLTSRFNLLRSQSEQTQQAIALTTFGEPEIGLLSEDLSWVRDYSLPIKTPSTEHSTSKNSSEAGSVLPNSNIEPSETRRIGEVLPFPNPKRSEGSSNGTEGK